MSISERPNLPKDVFQVVNIAHRGIGIRLYRWFNFVFGDLCGLYTVMNHFTGRKA